MSYRHPTKRPALALDTNIVQDNMPMEVASKVYIGSIHAAFNQDALMSLGITHILNASRLPPTFPKQFTYLSVDVRDKEDANILSCIPATNIFIEAGIDAGGVLVHCFGGRSRSAAFVAAYLMSSSDWDFDRVFAMIKTVRPVASINKGFETQLRAYGQANYDVYLAQQVLLRARVRSLRCIRNGHANCRASRDVTVVASGGGVRNSSRSVGGETKSGDRDRDRFPRSRPTSHSTATTNSSYSDSRDSRTSRGSATAAPAAVARLFPSSDDLVNHAAVAVAGQEGAGAAAALSQAVSSSSPSLVSLEATAAAAAAAASRVSSAGHKRSWGDSKECGSEAGAKQDYDHYQSGGEDRDYKHELGSGGGGGSVSGSGGGGGSVSGLDYCQCSSMGGDDMEDVYDADEEEEEALRGAGLGLGMGLGIATAGGGGSGGSSSGTSMLLHSVHHHPATTTPLTSRHSNSNHPHAVHKEPGDNNSSNSSNSQGLSPMSRMDPRSPRCRLSRPGSNTVRVIPPLRGLERGFSCSWCGGPLFCLANVLRLDLAAELPLLEEAISGATGCQYHTAAGGYSSRGDPAIGAAAAAAAEEKDYHADTITGSSSYLGGLLVSAASTSTGAVPMDIEYLDLDPGEMMISQGQGGVSVSTPRSSGIPPSGSSTRELSLSNQYTGGGRGAEAKTSVQSMSVPKVPLFSSSASSSSFAGHVPHTPASSSSSASSSAHTTSTFGSFGGSSFRQPPPSTMRGSSFKSFDFFDLPATTSTTTAATAAATAAAPAAAPSSLSTTVSMSSSTSNHPTGSSDAVHHTADHTHSLINISQRSLLVGHTNTNVVSLSDTPTDTTTTAVVAAISHRAAAATAGNSTSRRAEESGVGGERGGEGGDGRSAVDDADAPTDHHHQQYQQYHELAQPKRPTSKFVLDLKLSDKGDGDDKHADSPVNPRDDSSNYISSSSNSISSSISSSRRPDSNAAAVNLSLSSSSASNGPSDAAVAVTVGPDNTSTARRVYIGGAGGGGGGGGGAGGGGAGPSSTATSSSLTARNRITTSINNNSGSTWDEVAAAAAAEAVGVSSPLTSRGSLINTTTSSPAAAVASINSSGSSSAGGVVGVGARGLGIERSQSVEKRRWLARMKLLGAGTGAGSSSNSRVSSAGGGGGTISGSAPAGSSASSSSRRDRERDRESKVAKIAADDDEATRRALDGFVDGNCGAGHLNVEYLDWMGSEVLSAVVDEGEIRCKHCLKPIGNWTWTPSTRQTVLGQLEAPLIRIHSSAVHPSDFFLDPTPISTPRPEDNNNSKNSEEQQQYQHQQAKTYLMEK